MEDVYYTPEEIAERFKVTPSAVRQWIKQGKLKSVRLASLHRITESAIQDFLNIKTPTTRGRKRKDKSIV